MIPLIIGSIIGTFLGLLWAEQQRRKDTRTLRKAMQIKAELEAKYAKESAAWRKRFRELERKSCDSL